MRRGPFSLLLMCVGITAFLQSCKNDDFLTTRAAVSNQSFVEEFDTVSSALSRGWKIINVSSPKGSNIWQQGGAVAPWFAPYSSNGSYAGFIGANYESTVGGPGIISNWLISPEITMQNGDKIIFYTRSLAEFDGVSDTTDFGNSLQVRVATSSSLNVGSGNEVGDFSTALLDINPTIIPSSTTAPNPYAYRTRWTRFEARIFGLNGPVKGRFAFRYYLPNGGICATCEGNGVAIDRVQYQSVNY